MKARNSIIALAVVSLFLVLGDCAQHFFKVLEARKILSIIKPDDENFENVQDTLHRQSWTAAEDLVVMAAQGAVILMAMKSGQPNKHLQPTPR
jgi:hypothetical protein